MTMGEPSICVRACPAKSLPSGLTRGWEPVLRKRTCSNKKIEQDNYSEKSHPALCDGAQLSRVHEPQRVDFGAKRHLAPFRVEAASILQLEDVRIVEHAAVGLERPHDLVQPRFRRVADEGKAADA